MISTSSEGESVRRVSSNIGALLLRYQLSTGTRNAPLDNCDKSVARSPTRQPEALIHGERCVSIYHCAWGPTPTRSRSGAPLRGASLRPLARAAGAPPVLLSNLHRPRSRNLVADQCFDAENHDAGKQEIPPDA